MFRVAILFFALIYCVPSNSKSCQKLFSFEVISVHGEELKIENDGSLYFMQLTTGGRYPELGLFAEKDGRALHIYDRLVVGKVRSKVWNGRQNFLNEILTKFNKKEADNVIFEINEKQTDFSSLKSLLVRGLPLTRAIFNSWYGAIFFENKFRFVDVSWNQEVVIMKFTIDPHGQGGDFASVPAESYL